MNYTKNYHLPQWDETDRIMRVDFNQMCANLEDGITNAKETADEAAKLPYVVGAYVGNGETSQDVYLGFPARFVIICANQSTDTNQYGNYSVLVGGPNINSRLLYMTETGFRVMGATASLRFPNVNAANYSYDFIAFR